ncbi:MAG: hypothetical protein CVV33_05725 [Methanomicrobiales archaeon HGW-Methanomicrobiales-4]|nr:MAG: hypothetical protein CVV33_05725 [Methanomicrobiales archaeon HGW-Methanomicrobiales-4]
MFSSIRSVLLRSFLALSGLLLSGMVPVPDSSDPNSWKSLVISGRFQITVPVTWDSTMYDLPAAGQEMTIIRDPDDDTWEVQVIAVLNEEGQVCDETLLEEVSRSFMEGAEYRPLEGVSPSYNSHVLSLIHACTDKEGRTVMMVTRAAGPYIVFIIGIYEKSEAISKGAAELGVMAGSLVYII